MLTNHIVESLRVVLQSEAYGEALFRSAHFVSITKTRKRKIKTLWQLEYQTKQRVIECLNTHNLDTPSMIIPILKGSLSGLFFPLIPWKRIIKETCKAGEDYLTIFKQMQQKSPVECQALFDYIVAHEEAILLFSQIESESGTQDSLNPINALLAEPCEL